MENAAGLDALGQWRYGPQLIGLQTQHDYYTSGTFPLGLSAEVVLSQANAAKLAAAKGTPFTAGNLSLTADDRYALVTGGTSFQSGVVQALTLTNPQSPAWNFAPAVYRNFIVPNDPLLEVHHVRRPNLAKVLLSSNNGNVFVCDEKEFFDTKPAPGMALPAQCCLQAATSESHATKPMKTVRTTPSQPGSTTLIRSVRVHPFSDLVLGAKDSYLYLWDLRKATASAPTTPGVNAKAQPCYAISKPVSVGVGEMITSAELCPSVTSTLAVAGTVDGSVFCVDCRAPPANCIAWSNSASQGRGAITGLTFNWARENIVAFSSLSGQIQLIDCRNATVSLLTIPTTQCGVNCLQWFPHHSDMLVSGGVDGSVRMWNIRHNPSHCVSTKQFATGAVQSVRVLSTRQRPRVVGLTSGGDLVSVEASSKALFDLAPIIAKTHSRQPEDQDLAAVEDAEQKAINLFYARQSGKAQEKLLSCIVARLARKESKKATELLAYLQELEVQSFSFNIVGPLPTKGPNPSSAGGGGMGPGSNPQNMNSFTGGRSKVSFETTTLRRRDVKAEFNQWLKSPAEFAIIPQRMGKMVVDLDKPTEEVLSRLQAVRVNAVAGALIDSRDVDNLVKQIPLLRQLIQGGGHHTEECVPLILDGVELLMEDRPTEGLLFIQSMIEDCVTGLKSKAQDEDDPQVISWKKLIFNVLAPSVVDIAPSGLEGPNKLPRSVLRRARRIADEFLGDLDYIKASVAFDIKISRLSLVSTDACRQIVNAGKEFDTKYGCMKLISLSPLLLYIHSLLGCGQYIGFFCVASQWLSRHQGLPATLPVQTLFLQELTRLKGTLGKMTGSLRVLVNANNTHGPAVDSADRLLRRFHPFVLAVCRIIISCERFGRAYEENVQSQGGDPLLLLDDVLSTLGDGVAEALDIWAQLLALMASNRFSSKSLRDLITQFKKEVNSAMRELSASDDGTLKAIVDECSGFIAK